MTRDRVVVETANITTASSCRRA